MWYPVLDEERGMVMNKSQPDLVEVVAEGGCPVSYTHLTLPTTERV